jgi:hypothetical protein
MPDITREQYDAVRAACGWLEAAPDGGLAHLVWWEDGEAHGVDAWEDEEAFMAFGQDRLGPAFAAAGVEADFKPTFFEAHEVFLPQARTVTAS